MIERFKEYYTTLVSTYKRNKKNIPYVGEFIFRVSEYFDYVLKHRKYLKDNDKLKNIHQGKRCFIIGNGPSLLKQDLSHLKDEYTITVNSMTSTKEFKLIKPKYHIIVDYVRFDKNVPSMYEKMKDFKNLKHKPTFVFPVKYKGYLEENKLDKGLKISYLYPHGKLRRIKEIDFTKRIPIYANVLNAALSLAIFLGFSEIYLLGADMTGIVKVFDDEMKGFDSGGHFYSSTKQEEEYVKNLQSNRTNETFLSTYAQTFRIFRFTNNFAKRNGIQIFNATRGGTLDVFPRIKYEDIIRK